jgi:glutaredoxin
MTQPYVFPDFEIRAFNCPYCGAFSRQLWSKLYTYVSVSNPLVAWSKKLAFALCEHCGEASIWLNSSIIWPATVIAPKAHIDMPQDVAKDYEEARHVPRAIAKIINRFATALRAEIMCSSWGKG